MFARAHARDCQTSGVLDHAAFAWDPVHLIEFHGLKVLRRIRREGEDRARETRRAVLDAVAVYEGAVGAALAGSGFQLLLEGFGADQLVRRHGLPQEVP